MSLTIEFHLFHRGNGIVHDASPMRDQTVVFLHSPVERTRIRDWMCVFWPYQLRNVRFSPIRKSTAPLIVLRLAFGIYVFYGIVSSRSTGRCRQTECTAEARSVPRVAFSG